MAKISNELISERLSEYSEILAQQEANQFRVAAYQHAAETVRDLDREIHDIFQQGGTEALTELPNIGKGIAAAIAELLQTGRLTRLERLRGEVDPSNLFQTLPGVGPKLAQRIHDDLGIDTFEQLEMAAHDGRLERLPGISHGRARIIKAALSTILLRPRTGDAVERSSSPGVAQLLKIDQDYREKASGGKLPMIAPRRFNPEGAAWLPIMHSQSQGLHFTVLFSNTARAHELKRTDDWVVIYFYDDHHQEGQHTVVTETRGPLKGKRVVRGREQECMDYYGQPNK